MLLLLVFLFLLPVLFSQAQSEQISRTESCAFFIRKIGANFADRVLCCFHKQKRSDFRAQCPALVSGAKSERNSRTEFCAAFVRKLGKKSGHRILCCFHKENRSEVHGQSPVLLYIANSTRSHYSHSVEKHWCFNHWCLDQALFANRA